jgi:hypothetical protein
MLPNPKENFLNQWDGLINCYAKKLYSNYNLKEPS